MRTIDLRSDTAALPSPEMREAMATAEVGDDVVGEDPTANRLEEMAAEMLGKEAAVFVSSGTMGNLVAALTHCRSGDQMIVGDSSHMYLAEAGGASALGGIAYHPVPTDEDGTLDPERIEAAIHPDDFHYPATRMISVENTNNSAGGVPLTPEYMRAVADLAIPHNIPVHVDGARLFNAAVALEAPAAELVRDADTISFCLSKGLACPAGSVFCGTNEDVDAARRWRKMLGGGMRQLGVLAAAGVIALESMVDRLAEDHANARRLATGLQGVPGITIEPEKLPTNLVFFDVDLRDQPAAVRRLEQHGIRVGDFGPIWRLVPHYGITAEDIDYTIDVIRDVFTDLAVE